MAVRDPRENEVHWGQGEYVEVKAPEKIVFTWSWREKNTGKARAKVSEKCPVSEVTVELFEPGKDTELVLTHCHRRNSATTTNAAGPAVWTS